MTTVLPPRTATPAADAPSTRRVRTSPDPGASAPRPPRVPAPLAAAFTPPAITSAVTEVIPPCPPWCVGGCRPDIEGSVFHRSESAEIRSEAEHGGVLRVEVARLDDPDEPADTTVAVLVGSEGVDLTPAGALAAAELLREHALRAAAAAGVEVPARLVRVGDELLTADGWQLVELASIDTLGPPESLVQVFTPDRDTDDGDGWLYGLDQPVRVRRRPAGGAR